jgi:hypothetical protein
MPAYSANGRAIFERGNGLAFPNPGNPSPNAPVIYFHWFSWLLGFGIVKFGFDAGMQFVIVGVFASLLCSWLTLLLVEQVLPSRQFKWLLFLLTMWGGGILCVERIYANLLAGNSPTYMLLYNDPGEGWWFLNWGRNLLFPTEATYHAVVAACWLAVVTGHWWLATFAAAGMGMTHPFTGFQVLLIMVVWSGLNVIRQPGRQAITRFVPVASLLAAFLGYHFIFLERYEEHRIVREQMSVAWCLTANSEVMAYGAVGFLAACRLLLDRRVNASTGFFVVAFLVSFVLANHQWFFVPIQPLHFTRGYIWMPLCLLALPLVQRGLGYLRGTLPRAMFAGFVFLMSMITVSDNAAFLFYYWRVPSLGIVITDAQWDMLRWMKNEGLQGEFVASDEQLTYLASTYTSVRSYYSHWQHTPSYDRRRREAAAWFAKGGRREWLREIDYLLIERNSAATVLGKLAAADPRHWKILYENPQLTLLGHD